MGYWVKDRNGFTRQLIPADCTDMSVPEPKASSKMNPQLLDSQLFTDSQWTLKEEFGIRLAYPEITQVSIPGYWKMKNCCQRKTIYRTAIKYANIKLLRKRLRMRKAIRANLKIKKMTLTKLIIKCRKIGQRSEYAITTRNSLNWMSRQRKSFLREFRKTHVTISIYSLTPIWRTAESNNSWAGEGSLLTANHQGDI